MADKPLLRWRPQRPLLSQPVRLLYARTVYPCSCTGKLACTHLTGAGRRAAGIADTGWRMVLTDTRTARCHCTRAASWMPPLVADPSAAAAARPPAAPPGPSAAPPSGPARPWNGTTAPGMALARRDPPIGGSARLVGDVPVRAEVTPISCRCCCWLCAAAPRRGAVACAALGVRQPTFLLHQGPVEGPPIPA